MVLWLQHYHTLYNSTVIHEPRKTNSAIIDNIFLSLTLLNVRALFTIIIKILISLAVLLYSEGIVANDRIILVGLREVTLLFCIL